jgi:hypothetical protein
MPSTIAAIASIPADWWRGRVVTQYDTDWTWIALGVLTVSEELI